MTTRSLYFFVQEGLLKLVSRVNKCEYVLEEKPCLC